MPLMNIGGVTGNQQTLSLAICFLSAEKAEDYRWALNQLKELMGEHKISLPTCIITDRELALMNSLETTFSSSAHILCQWHVSMNVLAKSRRFFPKATPSIDGPPQRHPSFEAFLREWDQLLKSTTEDEFLTRVRTFKTPGRFPSGAVEYATKTWLPWKEKLVLYWVDQLPCFGIKTTSRLEGLHATMKRYIQVSTSDLAGVFVRLQLFWKNQTLRLRQTLGQERERRHTVASKHLFDKLYHDVHDTALVLIWEQFKMLSSNSNTSTTRRCTNRFSASMGLPCSHQLHDLQLANQDLTLEKVHPFWYAFLQKPGTSESSAVQRFNSVQEPQIAVVGGRRPHNQKRNQQTDSSK